MRPDRIEIKVDNKGRLSTEPQFPQFERNGKIPVKVTFHPNSGVTKITLKDFERLGDRGPNGVRPVKKKWSEEFPYPGTGPEIRLPDPDSPDTNVRLVKFAIELELEGGKKLSIDPLWDEMP